MQDIWRRRGLRSAACAAVLFCCSAATLALPAVAAPPPSVVVRLESPRPVLAGDAVRVVGVVPASAGYVRLEARGRSGWRTVERAAVSNKGTFRFAFVAESGLGLLRVRYGNTGEVSTPLKIAVLANGRRIVPRAETITLTSGVLSVAGDPNVAQIVELKAGVAPPRVGAILNIPAPTHSVFGRVTAVRRSRTGAIFVTTRPAALTDAYREYHVAANTSLAKTHPRLVQSGKRSARPLNVKSVVFSCSKAGEPTFPVTIDLSDTKIQFNLNVGPPPSIHFLIQSRPTFSAGIQVAGSLSCSLSSAAAIQMWFGPVAVKLSPKIELSVSGSLSAQFQWWPRFTYGFDRGSGDYVNVGTFDETHQFSLNAAAQVSLFAGANLSVELGGRVGVGGELGGELTGSPQGSNCISLDAALKAELTAEADVFVTHWTFILAQSEFANQHLGSVCAPAGPPPGGGSNPGWGAPVGGGGAPVGGGGSSGGSGALAGPSSSVVVGQGPPAPSGYRYDITLRNFAPRSAIPITCYLSGGVAFYRFSLTTDAAGTAHTASYCYTGDGPDHWVVAAGVTSNRVQWAGSGSSSPPPPTSLPSGPTHAESSIIWVPTFTNYHNASSPGDKIPPRQVVQVSCKVHDGTIASVNPDGYWYRIASSPWNNNYYAAANTFLNGDPPNGPYSRNTDFSVPDCGSQPTSPPTTSPPPPTTGPAAPANVKAILVTPTRFTLTWDAVPGAASYNLFLDGKKLLTTTQTSFDYGNFPCGEAHTPGVQTVTADDQVSAISTTTVTTTACSPSGGGGGPEPTPLAAPSGLISSFTAQNHLTVSWNTVAGATTYNVYLDGQRVGQTTSTSYDLGAFDCGKTLTPGTQAVGTSAQISTVSAITVNTAACQGAPPDTTPPSTPIGLTVYFPGNTGFTLGWNPATDNVGVSGYNVYLGGAKVATVGASQTVPALGSLGYVFNGLNCGTAYQIAISAFDAAGNTSAPATLSASTATCPSAVPAPTGLQATVDSANHVTLSWSAVSSATGYYLWLNGQRMLQVSGTSFGYGVLTCGQTFTLGIQTIVANGDVSVVATTTATTNPCGSPTPDTVAPSTPGSLSVSAQGTTTFTLSWAAASDNVGVTGYKLFLNGNQIATTAGTSYGFSALGCGTNYTLGVAAYDAAGNTSAIATIGGSTAACPPPPPTVTVSKGVHVTTTFCTVSACAYIVVSFTNFSSGNHTVTCYGSYPPSGAFYSYSTAATTTAQCIFGYPGYTVWATVDGVESNHLGW
jgi:hypothetical protein